MRILDVKQGSTEWLLARAGVFTASEFSDLVTPTLKRKTGDVPDRYVLRKVAERFMGAPVDQFQGSWAMEQGQILELRAIPWLEFTHGIKVRRVGFVTTDDGMFGCSPDGLIGEDGGIEVKSPQPTAHLEYLLGGVVPDKYRMQVLGSLWVTGRPWWDFCSYSDHFPSLLVRTHRDDRQMAAIDAIMRDVKADFDSKFEKVRVLKEAEDAPLRAEKLRQQEADIERARSAGGGEAPGEKWLREKAMRDAGHHSE
jgi:hypothetical protein